METISWLINLCVKHSREYKKTMVALKNAKSRKEPDPDVEFNFHIKFVQEFASLPADLSDLSPISVLMLAYFSKQTISGDSCVRGYEILEKLQGIDAAVHSTTYLLAYEELEGKGWLTLNYENSNAIQVRPYCFLQAKLDFGDALFKIQGNVTGQKREYFSNEEYLEHVFDYLNDLKDNSSEKNQVSREDDRGKIEWKPDRKFRRIISIVENTKIPLPAYEIFKKDRLSGWQYLFLMGLMAQQEKATDFDFQDLADTVRLFSQSYSKRAKMTEHLAGESSPLIKKKLIDGKDGQFGKEFRINPATSRMILGKKIVTHSMDEIKKYVKKNCIFDIETPSVKSDGLLLTQKEFDVVQTILHAESAIGRKARQELKKNLPATIGSPTGTTILLFGSPGTGKTLCAQYISSQLKVPLLKVDCSQILSMWVGGSEKAVKRLFTEYEEIVDTFKITPVLLLNEGEQLLSNRTAPRDAVDRMNNNIQNLFLEAMEKFAGIMIVTTNMKELLDSAFSRRFTYKLELSSPDKNMRKRLWATHIPQNCCDSSVNLDLLADLPLSGGEIRLVLEQAVRSASFQGLTKINNSLLMELAKAESFNTDSSNGKIYGFR